LLIVALQSGFVVLRIIAEHGSTGVELGPVSHKNVPIVMANLVPEVAKQAAIGFGQFGAALFKLRTVGLRERDRHHAVVVPGHDLRPEMLGWICEELERQSMARVLGAGLQRQLPAQEAIEEPVLGELDVPPGLKMRRERNVRDRVVVPAGDSEPLLPTDGRQPVADVIIRVGAKTARRAVAGRRPPGFAACGFEGRDDFELREIAEPMAAAAASSILKVDDVVAELASKQFHEATPGILRWPATLVRRNRSKNCAGHSGSDIDFRRSFDVVVPALGLAPPIISTT
jgi:hypothetical protein